jgi:hypothetical protein
MMMECASLEKTNCTQFSVHIDQSVLDDLPQLNDIDSDFSDDDSSTSHSEDSSMCSDILSYASYLSTVFEETEEDLLSLIGDNDADDESFGRITVPRSVSLDSYLAKNQQDEQQQEITTENRSPQHETVDCKSADSSSSPSTFNFKIAQRRLQRALSAINLRQALLITSRGVNEDLRLSIRIDQQKCDCFIQMKESLLASPPPKRSRKSYTQARNKLLNAMTSAAILNVSTE